MHIPNGYLGPKTIVATYLLMAPFWGWAWMVIRRRLHTMEVPHLALAAAFIFVIMMFNVPVPGGTTGHAVGASVAAIALGPWAAVFAVSFALIVQALFFGDGGVYAIGANCFNMAVLQVFVSLWVWKLSRPADLRASRGRTFWAGFAAGYAGLMAAAFGTAIMFGLQPLLERAADGTPLYSPYPLKVAVPAMMLPHLLLSIVEGGITGYLVMMLARDPHTLITPDANLLPDRGLFRRRSFWITAVLVLILVPVGLWLPKVFNAGDAWGEWSGEEAAQRAGLSQVPAGMAKHEDAWKAPVPDYAFGENSGGAAESLQYIGAAVLGVLIIAGVFVMLGKWQRSRMRKLSEGNSSQ